MHCECRCGVAGDVTADDEVNGKFGHSSLRGHLQLTEGPRYRDKAGRTIHLLIH